MTTTPTPAPDLVGVAEIHERTGISRQNLSNLAARRSVSDFPQPVQLLRMGPVYDWAEVERWAREKGYLK